LYASALSLVLSLLIPPLMGIIGPIWIGVDAFNNVAITADSDASPAGRTVASTARAAPSARSRWTP
jgi:hypothetical protein